jgi:hypothetical protein
MITVYNSQEVSGFCPDVQLIFCLLGYNVVQSLESQPTFQRNMSSPSSRLKKSQARNQHEEGSYLLVSF